MEIKINIPQNDYVQPTEVREEVVEMICKAFLNEEVFHPFGLPPHYLPTVFVARNDKKDSYKFCSEKNEYPYNRQGYTSFIRINGTEMQAAFEVLQKAGYFMYKVYTRALLSGIYVPRFGYICSKKPFLHEGELRIVTAEGVQVQKFEDFID